MRETTQMGVFQQPAKPCFIKLSDKQETTMTPIKQAKNVILAKTDSTLNRGGHWLRVAVMCLSFGFIFPHAMTENDDIAKAKKE
jgi:hypothetical protein